MDYNSLPLYKRLQWVNTLFLTLTPIGAAILTPLYIHHHGFGWQAPVFLIGYCAMTAMSITAGYHRMLSHKSYDCKPWVKFVYLLFGAGAFQGSALQWCTDHRRHHRFVDTEVDPHNINQGFFYAHMGWLFLKEEPQYANKYVPDLEADPMIAWQHKYFVPLAIVMGFGFPTFIGWLLGNAGGGFVFGGLLRVVVSNHTTFLINSLAHTLGTRPYSDTQTARDSIVMAVLGYGEGYHNYHHQFASDYRNGVRWYHWDPTKWLIWMMSLLGWTYRLKCIPASEVLRARMRNEENRLVQRGVPVERLQILKRRVEEAQTQWRALKEEYRRVKRNVQIQSRARLVHLKAESRVARLEFKTACRQWSAYYRTLRGLQTVSA